MKFYVREENQKQYHYQGYNYPIPPKNHEIKANDVWCDIWADYLIEKVAYSNGELKIYALKTPLNKPRRSTCYKKSKK